MLKSHNDLKDAVCNNSNFKNTSKWNIHRKIKYVLMNNNYTLHLLIWINGTRGRAITFYCAKQFDLYTLLYIYEFITYICHENVKTNKRFMCTYLQKIWSKKKRGIYTAYSRLKLTFILYSWWYKNTWQLTRQITFFQMCCRKHDVITIQEDRVMVYRDWRSPFDASLTTMQIYLTNIYKY